MKAADKKKHLAKKIKVEDKSEPWDFVKSTSYSSDPSKTKRTFKESGAYHREMMKGLSSPGYYAHRTAKDRQRGIE